MSGMLPFTVEKHSSVVLTVYLEVYKCLSFFPRVVYLLQSHPIDYSSRMLFVFATSATSVSSRNLIRACGHLSLAFSPYFFHTWFHKHNPDNAHYILIRLCYLMSRDQCTHHTPFSAMDAVSALQAMKHLLVALKVHFFLLFMVTNSLISQHS